MLGDGFGLEPKAESSVIFWGNLKSPNCAVIHLQNVFWFSDVQPDNELCSLFTFYFFFVLDT